MDSGAFSPTRVGLIAGHTLREAARQRLLRLLVLLLPAAGAGALVLRDFHFGSSELRFLLDAGFGAETIFGSILAVVATADLFFGETDRRTVLMVLAKPVGRSEFILGKLAGVLGLLLFFCGAATALLAALVGWRQLALAPAGTGALAGGTPVALGDVILCGLVQWLKLDVLAALTLLVCCFARSSLFAVVAGFAALVIGQLQHIARDFYAQAGSLWTAYAARLLSLALPDFQLFNVADRVTAGDPLPGSLVAGIALYALAYLGVFSALAIYCFDHREL
jgi:ABC-type transport system involved in multi-copper enzyme maturation permease subunit